MKAVIYHNVTGEKHDRYKYFETLGGAKRSLTALKKRAVKNPTAHNYVLREVDNFVAATVEDWQASAAFAYSQEMVETQNILNPGKIIMIRRSEKGTASDPGTETYHSM